MLTQIKGLHHVTSMAADAQENNDFFTKTLGLRRVKKTVNFDAPDVYHLYYGDEVGNAGSVMTYFPFANMGAGKRGTGEVADTVFSVPKGTLPFWQERLSSQGVAELAPYTLFGENRLRFAGPDGDGFSLAEVDGDQRIPFDRGPVASSEGIHGFRGVTMRLRDELETRGVFGAIFCAPATSSKRALVRLTLNAALTEAELEHLEAVAREIAPIVKPWDWPCARRARAQADALEA